MTTPPLLKPAFERARILALIAEAQDSLAGTTAGPWTVRAAAGLPSFVEAPEPPERGFAYNIEILGEDEHGYPTRDADVRFIAAAHRLIPEMVLALEHLLAQQPPQP